MALETYFWAFCAFSTLKRNSILLSAQALCFFAQRQAQNVSDGLKFLLHLNFLCFLVCYVCIYIWFYINCFIHLSLFLKKGHWAR